MKNYIRQWLFFICLCIPIITAAKALNKPGQIYWPSTQHKLGLGAIGVIPQGILTTLPDKHTDVTHNYKLQATSSYALMPLKKSYLSLEANISYSPTTITHKELGLRLEEQHIRLCPALAFTTINNKYFYVLSTIWFGYEWDFIVSSKFTEDDIVNNQWAPSTVIGNLILGERFEFFYGIYVDFNVTFPLTEFIHFMNKTAEYEENESFKNKKEVKRALFLLSSRLSTASWIDIGAGVNILSLLYPPQVSKR